MRFAASGLGCTLLASSGSLTSRHLRSLLARRTNGHGRVVGRERAWRRWWEALAGRRRTIRRHAVAGRRWAKAHAISGNGARAAREAMRSTRCLESGLLLELLLRRALGTWRARRKAIGRVRRLLLLLVAELGLLLAGLSRLLLLGRTSGL